MAKLPNVIDQYVGGRVKNRRTSLRMSQSKLAGALGISFQQVQKYEKGSNRIGASRLQQIAKFLQTTPSFFFEGAPIADPGMSVGFSEERDAADISEFLATTEGRVLVETFRDIADPTVRKRLLDLMTALAQAIARQSSNPPPSPPQQVAE